MILTSIVQYCGILQSHFLLTFHSDLLLLRDTVSCAWDTCMEFNIGLDDGMI